ncbi:protein suppressor 2 of zeste-like [Halyomorpha halys]|uniref:protein suppressor 2 of zeste-like n=1 Tax=Halyomorpha halys TaxID=286706 RepID=UPI0034D2C971
MLLILLLIGAALVGGEGVVPKDTEKPEAVLDTVAKEGRPQDLKRVVRQEELFYPMPKTHHFFHPPQAPAYPPAPAPPPPPPPQPPQQPQQPWQPPSKPGPTVPCIPSNGVQVTEGHFAIPHSPSSYSASLPYISGYKLTPIIGQKQIMVNDITHIPGPAPCVEGGGAPQMSYYQQVYGHGRQAEDFLKPFEQSGFFVAPPDLTHELRTPQEYQEKIEDLNSHVEHLESLRDNAAMAARG